MNAVIVGGGYEQKPQTTQPHPKTRDSQKRDSQAFPISSVRLFAHTLSDMNEHYQEPFNH